MTSLRPLATALSWPKGTGAPCTEPGNSGELDRFLDALLSCDRTLALELALQAVHRWGAVSAVHLGMVQPAMVQVGRLWQEGRISVAAEHTATAIVQYVVTSLYPLMEPASRSLGHVVVAGVAGEHHQLGAHLVSDALESDGWQVRFLGVDCSLARIVAAAAGGQPDVVALSCTMPQNLVEVERVIAALKGSAGDLAAPKVLVGGQGFGEGAQAARLAQSTGADAFAADLRQAVLAIRPWASA